MDILAAVAMVAMLVFVHEFGHFVVAKLCGVHVPVFSLGFGRRVVGIKLGGTDYRISALPFGGYVRMAGANFNYTAEDEEEEEPDDPAKGFTRRPVWQRLLVVAAGPGFNLVLPIVVFTALLMAGEPQPASVVGGVEHDTRAAQAGLQSGDRITAVDDTPVTTWSEVDAALPQDGTMHRLQVDRYGRTLDIHLGLSQGETLGVSFSRASSVAGVDDPASPAGKAGIRTGDTLVSVAGQPVHDWVEVEHALSMAGPSVSVTVQRDDGTHAFTLRTDPTWLPAGTPTGGADQAWGLLPATLFVGTVGDTVDKDPTNLLEGCTPAPPAPPSPASKAGIRPGDRFVAIGGQPVVRWADVLDAVSATMEGQGEEAHARPVQVDLIRDGKRVTLTLTPEVMRDTTPLGRYYYRPILGVTRMGGFVDGPTVPVYYPFPAAVQRATEETGRLAAFIVQQVGKLVTGQAAFSRSVGGPVEMVRQASYAASKGIFPYARLGGMLSISLGIVNLLPVPVLDGGQLLFFLAEAVRGRPLSHRLRERAQQVGVLFLVLLMLTVLIMDIGKWVGGS